MNRDSKGGPGYWNVWVNFCSDNILKDLEQIKFPSKNPIYRPQFVWDLSQSGFLRLVLRRYSRGDPIRELSQHFPGLLDAWELSNKLAAELNAQ